MRKSSLFGLMLGFASLGALVACSSTATSTPDPNKDGGPTADGSTPSDDDGGTTGGTAKGGTISISQTAAPSYTVNGSFYSLTTTGTPGPTPTNCETTKEGSCSATVCDLTAATDAGTETDAGTPVTPQGLSAGDITIEAAQTITVSYDAAKGTYAKTDMSKLYEAGGTINISAAGADVPAFNDSLVAPPTVTLTAPAANASIDGAAALDMTWTGGAPGSLNAIISTSTPGVKTASIICTFDANAGTGNISANLMGKLIKGTGAVLVSTDTVETLKAGDYNVSISIAGGSSFAAATIQ